jgi:hypothetical protein
LGETFHLYSVPAYDSKLPENLQGNAIGSVKQADSKWLFSQEKATLHDFKDSTLTGEML